MPAGQANLRHGSGVSLTDVHVAEAEVLEFLELPREQAAELLSAWLIIEPSAWLIAKEEEPSYIIIRLLFGFKYFLLLYGFILFLLLLTKISIGIHYCICIRVQFGA